MKLRSLVCGQQQRLLLPVLKCSTSSLMKVRQATTRASCCAAPKRKMLSAVKYWQSQGQSLRIRNSIQRYIFYQRMRGGDIRHSSTDTSHNFISEQPTLLARLHSQKGQRW